LLKTQDKFTAPVFYDSAETEEPNFSIGEIGKTGIFYVSYLKRIRSGRDENID